MNTGIVELYLQGMSMKDAKQTVEKQLHHMQPTEYRIRVMHGFENGTTIRDMLYDEYGQGKHPMVLRVENGWNHGITDLVLKEY